MSEPAGFLCQRPVLFSKHNYQLARKLTLYLNSYYKQKKLASLNKFDNVPKLINDNYTKFNAEYFS